MTDNTPQLSLFSEEEHFQRPYEASLIEVARRMVYPLWAGPQKLKASQVRTWMNRSFGGSDSDGAWLWKDVYEAQEAALVFLISEYKSALRELTLERVIEKLALIESHTLTHTKRSDESVELQQFSTPLSLGYVVNRCAAVSPADLVLEPSAGTGMLAQWATVFFGSNVVLNELSPRRTGILRRLFPGKAIYSCNAEQIHDYLPAGIRPTVIVMNPPFSATPKVERRNSHATAKHVRSALQRLAPGGRLVLISAHWFRPGHTVWEEALRGLDDDVDVSVRASVDIEGAAYAKHGTTINTRLTVIDKVRDGGIPTELSLRTETKSSSLPDDQAPFRVLRTDDVKALLDALPPREVVGGVGGEEAEATAPPLPVRAARALRRSSSSSKQRVETAAAGGAAAVPPQPAAQSPPPPQQPPVAVSYEVIDQEDKNAPQHEQQPMRETLYEVYQPQRIVVHGALPHPTTLCESGALSSVRPPAPTYTPLLPKDVVTRGLLSAAQLESVIYAGESHSHCLGGFYLVDDSFDNVEVTGSDTAGAVQFRRGWFLGDGTGAGKGRQVAGIILDNFSHGRTKALWVSKSDKLVEDARRDWVALGGNEDEVVSLSRFKLGSPIPLTQGIVFTTYATLRSSGKRPGQSSSSSSSSRLAQIIEWLGRDFDGVIAFDEAHAMGNAIADVGTRGMKKASQQGVAGLRIQNALPQARVLYVSATGATRVSNLAYASRLGLWQTGDFPFPSRGEFIAAIESGGVAAMEVVCRDLKALGLYFARNLSFEGVEYEALEVPLTNEQVAIYDTYAEGFQVIHTDMKEALRACNIVGSNGKSLNGRAKAAAKSLFESHKQRFFNHLITSMKCPALIRAIEEDIAEGRAVVLQVVSTNEELMKRRLAEIPTEEWHDLNVDITPREYIMSYLVHAFPIWLYEPYTTPEGYLSSREVQDSEGNPVVCQEALSARNQLIERIASLPPLPSALDQVIHHFGDTHVAEVTGRSHRILAEPETGRLYVSARGAHANLDEAQRFMDDEKRILIFSDAGGTGRSYHADLVAKNIRRRVHYLLEAGWKADNAIQGLGRSHRTNQASAPVFRPVVTDVRGERRFISTIARRLDSLGALTRGQRQTGGQGLFDPRDNLESFYAEAALRQLLLLLAEGNVPCCSLAQFEAATGLELKTEEGQLKQELPDIRQFLNRLLALPIQLQNELFEFFEMLLEGRIEAAIAAGTFEAGVETLQAESFRVVSRETVYAHPSSGGETICVEIEETQRTHILGVAEAEALAASNPEATLIVNQRSGKAAIKLPAPGTVNAKGAIVPRVTLVRPASRGTKVAVSDMEKSFWVPARDAVWRRAWEAEAVEIPPTTTRRFFLICGLLLPIWNSLDSNTLRVFRLQTVTGERLLGRMVEADRMNHLAESLGLRQVDLSPAEIYTLVFQRGESFPLTGGLSIRRSSIMQEHRIEVAGQFIAQALCDQLIAAGCFTEIVSYKRRVFIPAGETAAVRVIERVVGLLR
ncbi:strawberry notch family protein [Nodosilinea sp. LEGE 07298]|uniref:bifunctional class I SAM-dependent methyltransferase/DEAD/DEAH box helicase n=1 Tax=Nodosilinea sp. LEGE 07298 TaxID=2777970 RepID=UPI001880C886|nr:bifunctional class I SAM-dependent methyltransferase/DEAD/DEAH box helicase [Nodosilinea sp. LEGE 07298]MBE9108281.1 strawberry notch family protein [Nodosilinea sp. LEGE 07298]